MIYDEAKRLAAETGGYYLDQFTYAERATDWRGNNNIAESIFQQMMAEPSPIPAWIVCGAGTGGTSATIGRYIRYRSYSTRLCLADPRHSVFHRHYAGRSIHKLDGNCGSVIVGIGRPRAEPSFIAGVIDRAIAVGDEERIGAMHALSNALGRRVGGSTGTNLWACATIAREMHNAGETGSIVTLLCDAGERYADTYYSDDWLQRRTPGWEDAYEVASQLFQGRNARPSDDTHHSVQPR
jgi:cysteine synthase A